MLQGASSFVTKNWKPITAVFVLLIIAYYIKKYVLAPVAGVEDYDKGSGPIPTTDKSKEGKVDGSGNVYAYFDPEPTAKQLFDALEGVFTGANTKEAAFKTFTDLTRNEQVAVWNFWNQNFAPEFNDMTIKGAMEDEINVPNTSTFSGGLTAWAKAKYIFETDQSMNYNFTKTDK